MSPMRYLELLKNALGVSSDYALSQKMGWSRQKVSNYRNERHTFDVLACAQVAEVLDLDPMEVIIDMEIFKAQNDEAERADWEYYKLTRKGLAKTLSILAVICLSVGFSLTPSPAQAATNQDGKTPTVCIMLNRLLKWVLKKMKLSAPYGMPVAAPEPSY